MTIITKTQYNDIRSLFTSTSELKSAIKAMPDIMGLRGAWLGYIKKHINIKCKNEKTKKRSKVSERCHRKSVSNLSQVSHGVSCQVKHKKER